MSPRRSCVAAIALAVAAALGGCDSADDSGPAAGESIGVPANELLAERLPRVEYLGGPFLRSPRPHTVTFTTDDASIVREIERFGEVIGTTEWWTGAVDGYCADPGDCIGELRSGGHVRLADSVPTHLTDADLERTLEDAVESGRFGAIDDDTLLLTYLPPDVSFGDGRHPRYCGDGPRALHQTLRLPDADVPYAVIPRCGGIDELTTSASHELFEATTNPDPARRGFALVPDASTIAFTHRGVEPADPCRLLTGSPVWRERGFALHRVWSNDAAGRGADPCQPAPVDRAYRAVVPSQPAVRMTTPGGRTTITLHASADRPADRWPIAAIDLSGRDDGVTYVDLALDRSSVVPGDTATLTITLRRTNGDAPIIVGLASAHGAIWPLAVITRR